MSIYKKQRKKKKEIPGKPQQNQTTSENQPLFLALELH